jgi:regulator of sigma D
MLDNCSIEERWSGVNQLIERWLQERQSLILNFCGLSGVHELRENADPSNIRLQNFCQLLMDYVSAGHFEIYYQLIREAEVFEDGSEKLAQALMPDITATTSIAITFNDIYADANANLDKLPKSLSKLGETLASRFDMEDQLINTLHESHREQVEVA